MARTEDLKRLGMNIQVKHVKDLQEYPKNYNTHPDGQVAELGRSLTGPARQYKNIVVPAIIREDVKKERNVNKAKETPGIV